MLIIGKHTSSGRIYLIANTKIKINMKDARHDAIINFFITGKKFPLKDL